MEYSQEQLFPNRVVDRSVGKPIAESQSLRMSVLATRCCVDESVDGSLVYKEDVRFEVEVSPATLGNRSDPEEDSSGTCWALLASTSRMDLAEENLVVEVYPYSMGRRDGGRIRSANSRNVGRNQELAALRALAEEAGADLVEAWLAMPYEPLSPSRNVLQAVLVAPTNPILDLEGIKHTQQPRYRWGVAPDVKLCEAQLLASQRAQELLDATERGTLKFTYPGVTRGAAGGADAVPLLLQARDKGEMLLRMAARKALAGPRSLSSVRKRPAVVEKMTQIYLDSVNAFNKRVARSTATPLTQEAVSRQALEERLRESPSDCLDSLVPPLQEWLCGNEESALFAAKFILVLKAALEKLEPGLLPDLRGMLEPDVDASLLWCSDKRTRAQLLQAKQALQ